MGEAMDLDTPRLLRSATPEPGTEYSGEEPQMEATCAWCGGPIFLDQEFDWENDGAPIPPDDQAYWQHNDERYRPALLSWCYPS